MSKPSWAAIVQKPVIANTQEECRPMDVIVPEPPSFTDSNTNTPVIAASASEKSFNALLQDIDQQMTKIDEETEQKSDKFHKSYAYTRFSQEMDALKNARKSLEEKEKEIKRAIVLSESAYSDKIVGVIRKIKNYLGYPYESKYTGPYGVKSMHYSYYTGPPYMFRSQGGDGLRVSIMEALDVDYEFPNRIEIHFTVENEGIIPVVEAAIQEHLKGFVRDDNLLAYPTSMGSVQMNLSQQAL